MMHTQPRTSAAQGARPEPPPPDSSTRRWRALLLLLAGLLLGLALPGRASAQCEPAYELTCLQELPPVVWTQPGDSAWVSTTSQTSQVTITIHWCTPYAALDSASRTIYLDGVSVRDSFDYNLQSGVQFFGTLRCNKYATSQGTLTLTPGAHALQARIARQFDSTKVGEVETALHFTYTPPPHYDVEVTPASGTVQRAAGKAVTEAFSLTNTGNVTTTYTLQAVCSGAATGCTTSAGTATVGPGGTRFVGVTYTASSTTGATGTVRLKAWRSTDTAVRDSGAYALTTVAAPTTAFVGEVSDMTLVERGACVTAFAGEDAAYECGDLRVAHGLPGVRLLNRSTAPTLVYNSHHAVPFVVVPITLAGPSGTRPDTIRAAVAVNGVVTNRKWPGWGADSTKRIAVAVDASTLATGVYEYTLTVTATWNNGGSQTLPGRTGELVVVNRKDSPFGSGWWLAGLEQLVTHQISQDDWVWVAGDGSTRVYRWVDTYGDRVTCSGGLGQPRWLCGAWVAQSYDRPDTLKVVDTLLVRRLPSGTEVRFTMDGRHVETANPLGQRTSFVWSGTQLSHIDLPVSGYSYTFTYGNNSNARLSSVTSPAPSGTRSTTVTTDGNGHITRFTDPDSYWVGFGYGEAGGVMNTRTDRRGWTTRFQLGDGRKLAYSRVPVTAGDTMVRQFRAAEAAGTGSATAQANVFTMLFFPRHNASYANYMRLWLDSYGAPIQVLDILSQNSYYQRHDPRFPGLVTRSVQPNGATTLATYDARGNVVAQTDLATSVNGSYATTLYEWDPVWNRVTRVTAPEGETSRTQYDAYGRPAWVQPGPDSARRTTFAYYANNHGTAPGLIQSMKSPLVLAETYAYDARGNLNTLTAPTGLQTVTWADAIGRVDSVMSPGGAKRRITYDAADQVVEEQSFGPSRTAPVTIGSDSTYSAEQVFVHTYRNANGQPDSVARWQAPDLPGIGRIVTHFRYDGVGRKIVEIAPDSTPATLADNPRDSTVYDHGSNVTDVFTRRGYHITMRYDSVNRLTRRITPAASVTIGGTEISWGNPSISYFPWFGQDAEGNFTGGTASQARAVTIPADTATFGYDGMGNMLWANNRNARIARVWNTNGTLQSETQRIRTYAGTDTTTHAYQLNFVYDLNGRRTRLVHPGNISPSAPARDTTRYAYDPLTGELTSVSGQAHYAFHYDAAGRADSLSRGSTHETFRFDLDGRLYTRADWSGNILVHADTTSYDGTTGQVAQVSSTREVVQQGRRGLGALGWVDSYDRLKGTRNVEYFHTDPLANQLGNTMDASSATQAAPSLMQNESVIHTYEHNTGRLLSTRKPGAGGPYEVSLFDPAGNQYFRASLPIVPTPYTVGGQSNASLYLRDESAMYYGADDRLYVADRRSCLYFPASGGTQACDTTRAPAYERRSAFEEYRYDALGRRVLVRTRSEYACTQYCLNTLRRVVWDGSQVLYEISAPGGSTATSTQMEADTGLAVPFFLNQQHTAVEGFFPYGRVMYEHGGGLDAPLGVVRMEYSDELHDAQVIAPHATWRGTYDRGTPITGQCLVFSTNGKQLAPPPDSTPQTGDQYGGVVGGGTYNGTATHCIEVDWPSGYTWSARQYRRGYSGPSAWMGSLIFESRDASGLYYRRNRYYDSEKGRFTQEDPIGLAGGINTYGFAAGDPLSYSDPFGLCIPPGSAICVFLTAYREDGVRGVVNEAVGVTPLGDLNDLATAASGRNLITGRRAGRGGRAVAALGAMVPLASSSAIRSVGRQGEEILHRFGTEIESVEKLAEEARRAEANNYPHGVSVFNRPHKKHDSSTARRSDMESAFPVEETGREGHRTVVLPKPVTQVVADTWNRMLGRIP
jgi:RHS repeat-associated protein